MPYRCRDNVLEHEKEGKWSVKQVCKDHAACVRAMRLMYGIESGKLKPKK